MDVQGARLKRRQHFDEHKFSFYFPEFSGLPCFLPNASDSGIDVPILLLGCVQSTRYDGGLLNHVSSYVCDCFGQLRTQFVLDALD